MALNPKTAALPRNAGIDAAAATVNGGKLRIYDGTQPTDADTALGAQVLGADLALNATEFAAAASGSASANAISSDTSADATITAAWHSLLNSSNVRKFDGSVGTGTHNLVVNSTAIASGATVSCSSYTLSQPV